MTGFIGQALIYIVSFLLVLTFVVTIHELGHFLVARLFRVKIDRFSVGFGEALLSRTDKNGVEWRLGRLPIGGYVKFSGDPDATGVPDREGLEQMRAVIVAKHGPGAERDYLPFKPVWQRALIVAAGPAANFLLAAVLFTVLFSVIGEQIYKPRVGGVVAGSPAAAAGFQPGDLVTAVNGRPTPDARDMTNFIMLSAGDRVRFTVQRGNQELQLVATPRREVVQDEIAGRVKIARVGLEIVPLQQDFTFRRLNPLQAAVKGVDTIGDTVAGTFRYVGRIFVGKESGDMLNGPLGIATAAGGMTKQVIAVQAPPDRIAILLGLTFIQLAAIVSIGLGTANLLPIPLMDGGQLVFYGYEAVARRPVPARVQELGYRVGLALLAGLMLFATWNDLQKLSLFKFLGGLA